jgi:hypothetical protein
VKLAYADPPYLGVAHRYPEHPESRRWDDPAEHAALMADLDARFDGWALSLSAKSLPVLLPLAPDDIRVGAWVKPFSAFKKHVRIAYGWEPVIFKPARPNNDATAPQTRDWLAENMTLKRGLVGAKPARFCRWILDMLGYIEGDEVIDLFPGTGILGHVVAQGTLDMRVAE